MNSKMGPVEVYGRREEKQYVKTKDNCSAMEVEQDSQYKELEEI